MTLDELIERLEDIREEIGNGDVPVRGVQQPNYPLLARICAVTVVEEDGKQEMFIGLAEPREYGCSEHYADDFVTLGDDEEDEDDE